MSNPLEFLKNDNIYLMCPCFIGLTGIGLTLN